MLSITINLIIQPLGIIDPTSSALPLSPYIGMNARETDKTGFSLPGLRSEVSCWYNGDWRPEQYYLNCWTIIDIKVSLQAGRGSEKDGSNLLWSVRAKLDLQKPRGGFDWSDDSGWLELSWPAGFTAGQVCTRGREGGGTILGNSGW